MAKETSIAAENGEDVSLRIGDLWIWGIYITLCIVSVIASYSASSREVVTSGIYLPIIKHVMMLASGVLVVWLLQRMPYKKFIKPIYAFAFITIVLMIVTMVHGEVINGAKRAIRLPGFTLQPAELAKLAIVLLIAVFTAKNQMEKGVKTIGVALSAISVVLFGGLLVNQGLTNTILLMSISLSMMLIGGIQWKKFLIVIVVYMIAFGGFMMFKDSNSEKEEVLKTEKVAVKENKDAKREGTWMARLQRFRNPVPLYDQKLDDKNQQEFYARMAQAHGGITGVGPGNSRECSRLPLAFSDYIYSIIVEESGLWGGILLLILYLCLLGRAGIIASKCSRALPALLILGMAVMISFQAMFHMAINTGVFPVSGQPLPMISKGGTSILMTSIAFGIMLSVSRYAVQGNKGKEVKAEGNQLPENMRAANPTQIL
jgi:cell division protein FtsW